MKPLGSHVEPVFVFCAAIEVNLHSNRPRAIAHECERAVAVPKGLIKRRPKGAADRQRERTLNCSTDLRARQLRNQRRTVRANGTKELRIAKTKTQRAVAAHGDPGDTPLRAIGANAVVSL